MKHSLLLFTITIMCLVNSLSLAKVEGIEELKSLLKAHEETKNYSAMVVTALKLHEQSLQTKNITEQVNALKSLGLAYSWLGANDQALNSYQKAVELIQGSVSEELLSDLYSKMSQLLFDIGEYDEALKLTLSGVTIAEKLGDYKLLAHLYAIKGAVFSETQQFELAAIASNKAYMYLTDEKDSDIFGKIKNNVGMTYKYQKKYDLALKEFKEGFELAKQRNDELLMVYSLLELGDINTIIGNYKLSRHFLEQALTISKSNGAVRWKYYSHDYLAKLELALGDETNANIHKQKSELYKQIMFNEKVENRAELLKVNVAVMEYKNNIALLEKEKQIQSMKLNKSQDMIYFVGIITILISIALWITYRLYRLKARANYNLKKMANTDCLTGLPNRRYLLDKFKMNPKSHRNKCQGMAIIMLDLDHFKKVNDIYGHDHGDAVLVEVSKRLSVCLRENDLIARWGGEEFLICLRNTDKKQALNVAEILRKKISKDSIEFNSVHHQITATLGVAISNDADSFEAALKLADDVLYQGKETGRNKVVSTSRSRVLNISLSNINKNMKPEN